MSEPTASYRKVSYDLRPAKQIERRMMLDAFQLMAQGGFPIADYRYVGFGSVYFVDYILFHRLLGITDMVSVEHDTAATKRVSFNRPFANIELKFGPVSTFIPRLDRDIPHILWLDYDFVLDRDVIADVSTAASILPVGSILIITVDVEPPPKIEEKPAAWRRYFEEQATPYTDPAWDDAAFGKTRLPTINSTILANSVKAGLSGRDSVAFHPIFNFVYRDGHKMLTIGGVIGGDAERRKLTGCELDKRTQYARSDLSTPAYEIRVPRLTRLERLHLDANMPCPDGWMPTDFELSKEEVQAYREIYRFFPAYAELMLG
jgi:hypothetical protein